MEKLNNLLRKTFATATADEVCFIYTPKERIDKEIFAARFGQAEVQDDGVTYSFDKMKLQRCFGNKAPTPPLLIAGPWTLSIAPCTERQITSVVVPSTPAHTMQDLIITTYVPDIDPATTTSTTVVHFFNAGDAHAFKQSVEGGRW